MKYQELNVTRIQDVLGVSDGGDPCRRLRPTADIAYRRVHVATGKEETWSPNTSMLIAAFTA